jgi:hypothetical protein
VRPRIVGRRRRAFRAALSIAALRAAEPDGRGGAARARQARRLARRRRSAGGGAYYVLKEAEVVADGLHLGPVGGRIVAEVCIGLLQTDPGSYVATKPRWRPSLPSKSASFRMTDFLTFAGVDPQSRGQ